MNESIYAVCVEGRGSNEELINDDSERPKIDCMIVWKLLDELGCHVEGRALD